MSPAWLLKSYNQWLLPNFVFRPSIKMSHYDQPKDVSIDVRWIPKSIMWNYLTINEWGWVSYEELCRLRRITLCEISIILHMIRKPNSIIVYYSFEIIPSLKTWLEHDYLHLSIDVKFIFDSARLGFVQLRKYSPNSRCRPSSCLLAVLAMFLAIISPSSYSWNKWNVRHFCSHNQNNSTSSPGLLG